VFWLVCVCVHLYLFISQELTGAHFWQLDFNRMCGSVVVRVRREADEQQVLAYVTEKLSSVIAVLTVQIVKSNDYEQLGRTGLCVCVCITLNNISSNAINNARESFMGEQQTTTKTKAAL
jgi:hypothetical protein